MIERILREVEAARRRLAASEFLRRLSVATLAGLASAALLVLCRRWFVPLPLAVWPALAVLAIAGAVVVTILRPPDMRSAALALDRAAGLEERALAALHVAHDHTPVAEAVIRDAAAALFPGAYRRVPVEFPRDRRILLAALTVLALLLLPAGDLGPEKGENGAADDRSGPLPEALRRRQSDELQRRAYHVEELARARDNERLEELAREMRLAAEELRARETNREEAMARISTLEERLREERERLARDIPESLGEVPGEEGLGGEEGDEGDLSGEARKAAELASRADELERALADASATVEEREAARQALQSVREELSRLSARPDCPGGLADAIEKALAEGQGEPRAWDELARAAEGWTNPGDGQGGEHREAFEALGDLDGELEELARLKEGLEEGTGHCLACGASLGQGEELCGSCGALTSRRTGGGQNESGVGPRTGGGAGAGGGPGRGPSGRSDPSTELVPTLDRGPLNPGDVIGAIRFRAAPEKGVLAIPYEEVHRDAASRAAEALEEEEIPAGYRLHVRDYFDSIGPGKNNR